MQAAVTTRRDRLALIRVSRLAYRVNPGRLAGPSLTKLEVKSSTSGEGFPNYDLKLTSQEGIEHADKLLKKYQACDIEKLLYVIGVNQASVICDQGLIPIGVTARFYIVDGKIELSMCYPKDLPKRTGNTLNDGISFTDRRAATIYHPNLELPGISDETAAIYARAFIAGMKKVFFASENLEDRAFFKSLIHGYFGLEART
jgi:hypothetical protein